IDDARALIERFEREFKPDAPDYGELGEMMIRAALPPPSFSRLAQKPPPLDENDPWILLGQELIAKGVALNPTDVIFLRLAGIKLSRLLPKLALTYFEAALKLSPDDPDLLIGLGMVQGQLGDLKTAKATLRKAEQIARRQKRYDLEQQAQSMRSMVGTPMLDMLLDDQFDPEAMLDMLDEFDMPDY
ncbi:MAG: tetratricopeptide repeat protein, partial [Chloroflexia bacterium]|nr:tetratricopeptide repeat protein [Chloroflexia bacterium]